jgi:GTP-binding protein
VICYILDMSGSELRDPCDDFEILRSELNLYNPALLERPSIVVANKMDQKKAKTNLKKFLKRFNENGDLCVYPISALEKSGIEDLKQALKDLVGKQRQLETNNGS